MKLLFEEIKLSTKIFQGVQQSSKWSFHRKLKGNYFGNTGSWEVRGAATYRLFDSNPFKILYREEGVMTFEDNPNTVDIYQEYLYHFENPNDISVFFVSSENGQKTMGDLFHTIVLRQENHQIRGEGFHLCGGDEYKTDYLFEMNENLLERFHLNHQVMGHKKNYVANTVFLKEGLELQFTRML